MTATDYETGSATALPEAERAYPVEEAVPRLGMGSKSTLYAEIRAGRLEARKNGARTVILQSEITRYLRALPTYGEA